MKTAKKPFTFLIFSLVLGFAVTASNLPPTGSAPYYFETTVTGNLEEVTEKVKQQLKKHGFGVITEVNMHEKLNNSLDKNLKPYKLLGVCDPSAAYKAMNVEQNIGLMLPCKVIIRETGPEQFMVTSIDPEVMMATIGNDELMEVGREVSQRLKNVINGLK